MKKLKIGLIVAAIALLLVPVGMTWAADPTPTPTPGLRIPFANTFIEKLASKLGIDQAKLGDAIQQTMQELRQEFQQNHPDQNRPDRGPKPFGFGGGFKHQELRGANSLVQPAADYVGLSVQDFMTRLRNGETPAKIAESQGKTKAGLVSALLDKSRQQVNQAVRNGRLTQQQADDYLKNLETKLNQWVDQTMPAPKQRQPAPNQSGPRFNLPMRGPASL